MTHDDTRTDALRSILIETVDATPALRPRPSARMAAAAIAAFAIAGAATGGAISAAGLSTPGPVSEADIEYNVTVLSALILGQATPYGQQFSAGSDGVAAFDLGARPSEATALAIGVHCIDAGVFTTWVDGEHRGELTCDDDEGMAEYKGGSMASLSPVTTDGTHSLRIESKDGARYVVWASWASETPLPASSSDQELALSDGVVTREEYLEGFDRFAACMAEGGWPVEGVDRTPTVLTYSTRNEAYESGLDTECYWAEFQKVDEAWQIANEDTSESTEIVRQCLRDLGIDPAYKSAEVVEQLYAAGVDLATC